jgi:hypothetical protein
MSQVKALCTQSESALVQASRKPELEKLSPARVKQLAARARKLFDKWQGQGRSQARARSRQVGSPDVDTRTQQKALIFKEALTQFESRLERLQAADAVAAGKAPSAKPKKARAAEHRAPRARVRAKLAETAAALNVAPRVADTASREETTAGSSVSPDASATAGKEAAAGKSPDPTVGRPFVAPLPVTERKPQRTAPVSRSAAKKVGHSTARQRGAATAAKQSRVARSGLTSRVRGHVSARGRRAQARRDQKNS